MEAFSEDETAKSVNKTNTKSFADFARSELESEVEDSWSRYCVYLFPLGTKERTWCLASIIAYVFIFDGMLNNLRQ